MTSWDRHAQIAPQAPGPVLPVQVLVIAKAPVAGCAKTRLCPPLSLEAAAELARAALIDTLDAVCAAGAARAVLVLDGEAGDWLHHDVVVLPQRTGDLAERLAGAFEDAWSLSPMPAILVGMDTPQITPQLLQSISDKLLQKTVDAVLGPTTDGGFWCLGVKVPVAGLFSAVPMSTSKTGAVQLARLNELGLTCSLLEELRDVDFYDDAMTVAHEAVGTHFAQTFFGLQSRAAYGDTSP